MPAPGSVPVNFANWLTIIGTIEFTALSRSETTGKRRPELLQLSLVCRERHGHRESSRLRQRLPQSYILLEYLEEGEGTDVTGTIIEVGPGVERFGVGDRVFAQAVALFKESNKAAEGDLQFYTVIREHMAALTPVDGPDLPQVPARPTPSTPGGRLPAVIVTVGSSSVGRNAVQLTASAGYEVLSTSSPKNFAYVQSPGAAMSREWAG
ncbi:hypothetical protein GGR53DRAFT_471335 [Hypoxylon sp. FL1150]|nr:hypothetical protein GGR53DRAFT_471335 [Hypoxylon sp. FL1150]